MNPIPASQTRQTTWYRGLAAGNHSIEVIRMRGTPRAAGFFFGFSRGVDGRWLALPPKPGRQIEFVADSGSTGYGDLSTTADCTDEEVASRSDASQSYAIVAAHELHADWQLNAMDGIGVVRNWHGIWSGTNYATYARLTVQSDSASRYRDIDWQPQVAVVRIGNNDFGSPLGADEPWTQAQLETAFTDGYRNLLVELRGRLGPNGLIIVIRPAFGDNPANQKGAEIVDSLRSGGDLRLYELQFPKLALTGCNFHPNLSDHRLMSATLVKFIEDHGGAKLHWTPSSR
jgi:lysophospholipase L1-like esterase